MSVPGHHGNRRRGPGHPFSPPTPLALMIDGLTVDGDLPGPPPGLDEFAFRWQRRD
ncbi:hypothetical protein ABIA39_002891 [Nocardia sp. GAS34]|uniref:hypothetical protein n=1 Tax=unclassified Nocardia TaxID=2637762 RepID=UPI003D260A51